MAEEVSALIEPSAGSAYQIDHNQIFYIGRQQLLELTWKIWGDVVEKVIFNELCNYFEGKMSVSQTMAATELWKKIFEVSSKTV